MSPALTACPISALISHTVPAGRGGNPSQGRLGIARRRHAQRQPRPVHTLLPTAALLSAQPGAARHQAAAWARLLTCDGGCDLRTVLPLVRVLIMLAQGKPHRNRGLQA